MERADLRRRDGSPYTVIKNPHGDRGAGRYLRLEPADIALVDLMDGRRTIQDIVIETLQATGVFALDRLARLTSALGANGFFGEEIPQVYQRLARQRAQGDPLVRAALLLRRLIVWDIARWNNADRFAQSVYRSGGRLAFTPLGAVLIGLICLAGLAAWVAEVGAGRHALATIDGSFVLEPCACSSPCRSCRRTRRGTGSTSPHRTSHGDRRTKRPGEPICPRYQGQ